jgi:hypothetical protein
MHLQPPTQPIHSPSHQLAACHTAQTTLHWHLHLKLLLPAELLLFPTPANPLTPTSAAGMPAASPPAAATAAALSGVSGRPLLLLLLSPFALAPPAPGATAAPFFSLST